MIICYNLRPNILDKFTKLSNVGFLMKYFTTGFLQFCSLTVKICFLGDPGEYFSILKFPNFLRS